MKISSHWIRRPVSACIVICLGAPFGQAAVMRQQPTTSVPSGGAQSADSGSASQKPAADLTGTKTPPAGSVSAAPQAGSNAQSGGLPALQKQQQNNASQPVGTAAAPYEKTEGISASRPAGAVVAPAKQRRTRSFLIRVSVIVGAAVAIGTVAALSKGSPSRP